MTQVSTRPTRRSVGRLVRWKRSLFSSQVCGTYDACEFCQRHSHPSLVACRCESQRLDPRPRQTAAGFEHGTELFRITYKVIYTTQIHDSMRCMHRSRRSSRAVYRIMLPSTSTPTAQHASHITRLLCQYSRPDPANAPARASSAYASVMRALGAQPWSKTGARRRPRTSHRQGRCVHTARA